MVFAGTLAELQAHVAATGARGSWSVTPSRANMFRGDDGAILNWWESSGTVQFQGPQARREALERAMSARLDRQIGLFG